MKFGFAALISFAIAVLVAPVAIPVLHKLKFGQEIREEGPKWHSSKSGTPTMGGVIFILAVLISGIIFLGNSLEGIMLVYLSVAFGVIGFIDDYIKVAMKRNLGLTEIQKLVMQLVASVIFVGLLYYNGLMETSLKIPFTELSFDMGIWYLPFAVLVIIGCVNAVNLTDGIDGLASSVSVIVFIFFAIVLKETPESMFAIISAAAVFGFFLFNKYPAKVFMGDTGSLFLGGALAGIAVCKGYALYLVIAGGIYVLETLSVILQVTYFKATGKRLFKMSPVHHHFEMCGWSEVKIVLVFSLVTVCLCALAAVKFI
ncbi:MAG: phospho-N-acetylmuramoyl-pentapeptide-transferase [Clostridia bacterium]|nr:phospho-N-acetylmuramoyl-pentapeptide-transferase [Clostridia bacterium]MBR2878457.1 phospho-N-acetylmuramoyl-pentapeptide-transferase [Clostridia bacterium]